MLHKGFSRAPSRSRLCVGCIPAIDHIARHGGATVRERGVKPMTDLLFIVRKDLRYALRLPQVWVWMFFMPLGLSYLVGTLMGSILGRIDQLAVYTAPRAGFLAEDLTRRLA